MIFRVKPFLVFFFYKKLEVDAAISLRVRLRNSKTVSIVLANLCGELFD